MSIEFEAKRLGIDIKLFDSDGNEVEGEGYVLIVTCNGRVHVMTEDEPGICVCCNKEYFDLRIFRKWEEVKEFFILFKSLPEFTFRARVIGFDHGTVLIKTRREMEDEHFFPE